MYSINIKNQPMLLAEFALKYSENSKHASDMQYLTNANVIAFYSKKGILLGGFAVSNLTMNKTLRYFDFIGEQRDAVLKEAGILAQDISEITYTFLTHQASKLQRIFILASSIFAVRKLKTNYTIGGGIINGFNQTIKSILPYTMYEGEVLVSGRKRKFSILYAKTNGKILALVLRMIVTSIKRIKR